MNIEIKNKRLIPIEFSLNYLYKNKEITIFKRKKQIPIVFSEKFDIHTNKFIGCYWCASHYILIIPRVEKNTVATYEWYWYNYETKVCKQNINILELDIVFEQIIQWHNEFYDYQTASDVIKEHYEEYLIISGQKQ